MGERKVAYRVFRSMKDGQLWCESRNADEVIEKSYGFGCTYETLVVYEVSEGWQHWDVTDQMYIDPREGW